MLVGVMIATGVFMSLPASSQTNGAALAIRFPVQAHLIPVGGTFRLEPEITGTPPVLSLWIKNAVELAGTNTVFAVSNAQSAHSGFYQPVAFSAAGVATGAVAEVIVTTGETPNFPWEWERRFPAAAEGQTCELVDAILDTTGNVYVTGHYYNPTNGGDIFTAKLDRQGRILWTANYDDISTNPDRGAAVALDAAGNCYMAGSTYRLKTEMDGDTDYVLIKYSTEGQRIWTNYYDSGGSSARYDEPYSLVVDPAQNVYVAGVTGVIKYDADGHALWTNQFPVRGMVAGPMGTNFFVALRGRTSEHHDLGMLDPTGQMLWTVGGPNRLSGTDPGTLAVDPDGNAVLIGVNYDGTQGDIEVLKVAPDGAERWRVRWNGPDRLWDSPSAVCTDAAGNVLVAGYSWTGPGMSTVFKSVVLKYSPQGTLLWSRDYRTRPTTKDSFLSVSTDAAGNVYACGSHIQNRSPSDETRHGLLVKYSPSGELLWSSRYARPQGRTPTYAGLNRVFADGSTGIVAAGYSSGVVGQFHVLRYDLATPKVAPVGFPLPGVFAGCLANSAGHQFEIQVSRDLQSWQRLTTIEGQDGLPVFFDRTGLQHSQGYYRAVSIEP